MMGMYVTGILLATALVAYVVHQIISAKERDDAFDMRFVEKRHGCYYYDVTWLGIDRWVPVRVGCGRVDHDIPGMSLPSYVRARLLADHALRVKEGVSARQRAYLESLPKVSR